MRRRTAVMLMMRSNGVSGRATSPMAPMASSVTRRSARTGGIVRSAMLMMSLQRALHLVGEEQVVDAALQRVEGGRPHVGEADMAGIELGLHPPRMRRQDQDAVADEQRLLDGMGDEDDREAHVLPQRDQLLLHLAAGERVE